MSFALQRLALAGGFRLFPFRSPLLRESRLLSFPGVTKMFQFTPYPTGRYTPIKSEFLQQVDPAKRDRVAPFGNRRIIGLWHLPDEYRRRMRPSSAKAS